MKYHFFFFDTSFIIKVDPVYWNNKFFIRLQNRLFLVNLSLLNNNLVVVEAEIEIVCEVVREQLVKRNRILQKFWESFNEFFLHPINFFVRLICFIFILLLFPLFINNSELVVYYFKQVFLVVTNVNLLIIFLHLLRRFVPWVFIDFKVKFKCYVNFFILRKSLLLFFLTVPVSEHF